MFSLHQTHCEVLYIDNLTYSKKKEAVRQIFLISIVQVSKLEFREMKEVVQYGPVSSGASPEVNPRSDSKAYPIP